MFNHKLTMYIICCIYDNLKAFKNLKEKEKEINIDIINSSILINIFEYLFINTTYFTNTPTPTTPPPQQQAPQQQAPLTVDDKKNILLKVFELIENKNYTDKISGIIGNILKTNKSSSSSGGSKLLIKKSNKTKIIKKHT
jgi:hypothetical protein